MQVHHRLHHIIRFLFFRVVNCFHSGRGRYGGGLSCTCSPPSGFVFSSLSDSFLLFRFLGPFPCSALCNVANNKTNHSAIHLPGREKGAVLGVFEFPVLARQSPSNHHRQTDRALGSFFFLVLVVRHLPTAPAQSLHQARVQTTTLSVST